MKTYTTHDIKNVVLLGASGSGKTTLAEAMAFDGGVIDRRGSVENDNTLSDYTDVEHLYKRSIYPTILFAEYMGRKLNIIDTPGSDDFCGGLFSAFRVADVGVMLLNAQNGFEVGTEIQARYARRHEKPIIAVINQLDHEKASWEGTLDSLKAASQVTPVVVQYPVNPGPGFDAFVDVLLMKMYRFKGDTGVREELEIPEPRNGTGRRAEPHPDRGGRRERRGADGALFRQGRTDAGRAALGSEAGTRQARPDPGVLRFGQARHRGEAADGIHHQRSARSDQGARFHDDGRARDRGRQHRLRRSLFVFKSAVEPHLGEMTLFPRRVGAR